MQTTKFTRENIKLTFKKPKYYVNKANGIVRCVLNYTVAVPFDNARVSPLFPVPSTGTVRARAVLQKGDEWNEEVGKKIALARAENQAYTDVKKYVKKFLTSLYPFLEVADMCFDFIETTTSHNIHNEDYIANVGG